MRRTSWPSPSRARGGRVTSLADGSAFRAWIFRILNNTFISDRRKALARPREELLVEDGDEEEGAFSIFERLHQPFLLWFANPEQEFLDKLLREDLDRALAALPEHYRVVVVLADVEGLKYGEIAETLDVPIGTVRSRLARARCALQRTLWNVARDHGLQTSRSGQHLEHHRGEKESMSERDDIGCEQALKRLAEFIDRELSDSEHDSVERHLRTCRSCYSRMEFESRLKQRLSELSADDAPTKSRDRIRELIQGF